jgi:hypothetical protein
LNTTSKSATNVADTVYWWRAKAVDAAGNESAWSPLWKLTVDSTSPVANIDSPGPDATVRGVVDVVGTVTDVNPLNTYFRITGPSGYGLTSFYGDGRTSHELAWDTTALQNGTYRIQFETRDKAGNKTSVSTKAINVTVANPVPSVTATDFGVGSWTLANDGFTAFSAGFTTQDFDALTGASVTVYGADGRELATNTATPAFIGEINTNGWTTLSSPFVTNGSFDDNFCGGGECWDREATQWTAEMKPAKAVVTVTGLNARGESVTETSSIETFSEAVAQFESIVPVIETNIVTPPGLNGQANQPQSRPASRGTFQAARVLARNPSVVTTNSGETNDTSVLGVSTSTEGQESSPEVLSSNISDTPYENFADAEEAVSQNSTSWLWWLTLPAVLGAGTWIYGASRRNK